MSPDDSQCPFCKVGFVVQLICGDCGQLVERGRTFCQNPTCSNQPVTDVTYVARSQEMANVPPSSSGIDLAPLPQFGGAHLPAPVHVAPSYVTGKFGVTSYVTHEGRDAAILTTMSKAVTLLHALAAEMNNFQGIMPSTRRCIKGCRDLATELQEEIEERRGPQG